MGVGGVHGRGGPRPDIDQVERQPEPPPPPPPAADEAGRAGADHPAASADPADDIAPELRHDPQASRLEQQVGGGRAADSAGQSPSAPRAEGREPGRVNEAAYGRIRERLSRGATDWAVTDQDTTSVRSELSRMNPQEYQATIRRMNRDGLLRTYVDEMPSEERHRFLQMSERQGMVSREPAFQPPGGGSPPRVPSLWRNDPSLPEPMRDAIHQRNIEGYEHYNREYRQYVNRYAEQVPSLNNGADFRRLGPPAEHACANGRWPEPGLDPSNPRDRQYQDDWNRTTAHRASNSDAMQAVDVRTCELTGRTPGGQVYAHGRAGVEGQVGERRASADAAGRLGTRGSTRGDANAGTNLDGRDRNAAVSSDGRRMAGAEPPEGTVEGQIPGTDYGGQVRPNGEVELSGEQGAVARWDPNEVRNEVGAGEGAEFDREVAGVPVRGRANIEAGVGMTGLHPDTVRDIVADPNADRSLWRTPPEAEQGIPWRQLPAERRAQLERGLWNQADYDRALAGQQRR